MKKLARHPLLLLSLALCVAPSTASELDDYRLAGTLDNGARGWLAVIERPDGEQRLVRKGDTIAGGEVLAIGEKCVRVRRMTDELMLSLEGGESDLAFDDLPPELFNLQASESLRETLNELERDANSDEQLVDGIGELLNIPEQGQIAAIDDLPVRSPRHSLRLLKKSLLADHPVRIAVSGVEGFDAVYVMPAPPRIDRDPVNIR